MNWLIVTDLDGTLLDDGYLNAKAGAALDTIADGYTDTRIALASSKTPTEMIELVRHCDSDPVLIFENGSGMAWREAVLCRPGEKRLDGFEVELFGRPYADVVAVLRNMRFDRSYHFRGFSDMTPGEVAARTGLSPFAAEKARHRVASEPIVWEGTAEELRDFEEDLGDRGLELVRGGRFYHVGSHMNKGRALKRLWRTLRFQFGVRATTVACGDAPNDLDMMERADHAVVFPSRSGGYLEPDNPNTSRAPVAGASAWLDAVRNVLDDGYREMLSS
jgi:mannosyl-3-phosphoglycerate phosphatase